MSINSEEEDPAGKFSVQGTERQSLREDNEADRLEVVSEEDTSIGEIGSDLD